MNSMHRLLKGKGAQLLYLDFDGVLHHDSVCRHPRRGIYIDAPGDFSLFQHAQLLEEALEPYAHVQIILSTSWVRGLGFSRARRHLPLRLRSRVIGATFHTFMDASRFAAM